MPLQKKQVIKAEKELLIQVGKRVKKYRIAADMTQNDLAMECNFEKASMSRIEAGLSNTTIRTLAKIAKALGIQLADLFQD